jgi:DNA-binding transcriptional LysR family regulator
MTTIDLNRIATFVRVVEAGSFTAAARKLRVPVSSVSRAIANLEWELGVRLMHRTTRRLSLTDGGEHFFQRMQTVISETEEATRAVAGLAGDPRGLVRITAPPEVGARAFPRIIATLLRRHPGLVIDLKLTNRVVDLVADGIDLAVRGGLLEDSSLVARKVAPSELGLFASAAYLERRGRPRRPSDLTRHDCLVYAGREGKLPWRLTGPRGEQIINVSGSIMCDDMVFLREAAVAGLGVTMVPTEITTAEVKAGRLERVLPRHGYQGGGLYLVWPSAKLVPARVIAVREVLIEELSRWAIYD